MQIKSTAGDRSPSIRMGITKLPKDIKSDENDEERAIPAHRW